MMTQFIPLLNKHAPPHNLVAVFICQSAEQARDFPKNLKQTPPRGKPRRKHFSLAAGFFNIFFEMSPIRASLPMSIHPPPREWGPSACLNCCLLQSALGESSLPRPFSPNLALILKLPLHHGPCPVQHREVGHSRFLPGIIPPHH